MPSIIRKLTERGYWDSVHEGEGRDRDLAQHGSWWRRSKRALKRVLGGRLVERASNYDEYILWETILPDLLAGRSGQRAVEIGSAPGEFLVTLRDRSGLDVYGIEYSAVGADLNRAAFAAAGISSSNVIDGDVFAIARDARYRGFFDVVISRGFIEHFTDPGDAIDRHLDLLRDGGLLIISVPNLRGMNFLCSWLLDRSVLAMHNLAIMSRQPFGQLFAGRSLEPRLCRYYGTFNLSVFNTRPDAPTRPLLHLAQRTQPVLNIAFHTLFGRRSVEHRWFSPNLIFAGVKKSRS